MEFQKTHFPGVYLIKNPRSADTRGFFYKSFCQKSFSNEGLRPSFTQTCASFNTLAGTFRGLHYQLSPYGEEKLVSVHKGSIVDYLVDLREDSPTYLKTFEAELSEENGLMLFIPEGIAHGFQTLRPETIVQYNISSEYSESHAVGVRFNDPLIEKLELRLPISQISPRDQNYLLLKDQSK